MKRNSEHSFCVTKSRLEYFLSYVISSGKKRHASIWGPAREKGRGAKSAKKGHKLQISEMKEGKSLYVPWTL